MGELNKNIYSIILSYLEKLPFLDDLIVITKAIYDITNEHWIYTNFHRYMDHELKSHRKLKIYYGQYCKSWYIS
jgi:hypothetical protein